MYICRVKMAMNHRKKCLRHCDIGDGGEGKMLERKAVTEVLQSSGSTQQTEKLAMKTKVLFCYQEPPILLCKQKLY